jgi:hypothetical protein
MFLESTNIVKLKQLSLMDESRKADAWPITGPYFPTSNAGNEVSEFRFDKSLLS